MTRQESQRRYDQSPKGRARWRRYNRSAKGHARDMTPARIAARLAWYHTPYGKLVKRRTTMRARRAFGAFIWDLTEGRHDRT